MTALHIGNLSRNVGYNRAWFYFDSVFYMSQCIEKGISPPLGSSDSHLQHYLNRGGRLGLSPNPLFDEDYYRRRYPEIAKEIESGKWSSGFEHYARVGVEADLSPIWFFDGIFYKTIHHDLTDENLRFGGFVDRYCHYLQDGLGEFRAAHWCIKALQTIKQDYGFPVNQTDLRALLSDNTRLASLFRPVFDYDWMAEKYSWGRAVPARSFIRYYLLNVKQQKLSPSPYFNEVFYLTANPEINEAVQQGTFTSGFEHFLLHGMYEWRRPFADFDGQYYYQMNMAREAGVVPSPPAFVHFLSNHRKRRLPFAPPLSAHDIPETAGKGVYERRCALNAPLLSTLDFAVDKNKPDVSIIIVARDNFDQTANCIVSAVYNTKCYIEVVLFDNASSDNIRNIPSINPQIKYLRAEENEGFTIAVNRAAEIATGRMLLLLNNDVELTPRAIDLALETLESDRTIGAVGAKIVRMHGRLQEAGSLVWRDGSCLGYGRDKDPLDGQVSFVQDVDFCSGCFLAVLRSEWEEMGGFDEAYAPAYYEETDFCLRLWQRGKRVVYDPRIVIWHFEFGTSLVPEESFALMRRNQRYFANKHRAFLTNCLPAAVENIERARLRHVARPRVLFIEDHLPDPKRGMGQVRSAAVADVLARNCGLVSMLGLHDSRWPTALPRDQDGRRVEVLTGLNTTNIENFLAQRVGAYDVVWLSRTHNLPRLRDWRAACPAFFAGVRVVLDTEAISATRRFAYAQHAGQQANLPDLVLEELEHLDGLEHICAVNQIDRRLVMETLAQRGLSIPVSILGHALTLAPHFPRFEEATDIVLTGAFSEVDSPNADALLWFDQAVRPMIKELPGLHYVLAGSQAARFAASAGLRHEWRIIDNPPDMAAVLASARLMVAPTRFAAGIPMKVHEAASHGVPVVMTELLAEQLGWMVDDISAVRAKPEAMAAAIETLALNREAWHRSQALQARLVGAECDPALFEHTIRQIVADPSAAAKIISVPVTRARKRESHAS